MTKQQSAQPMPPGVLETPPPLLDEIPVISIKPTKGWVSLNLGELWAYRELLFYFVWRDIKVRYKQTVLGAAWAIIQPFFTMVVFSLFFGRLEGISPDEVPYPLFSYAALVPWTFFANGLSQGSNTLVTNANMVKKIYFPRLTMPVATVLAGLVDFVLAFVVLIGMMLVYGYTPALNILWLPLFLLLALITALGGSLWLSAMNVQFRDVRYVIPFIVQLLLFLTPIVYSRDSLDEPIRTLSGLNPMAGVVEGFRWALLGEQVNAAPGPITAVSALIAVLFLISGLLYFRRMEKTFADVV